MAKSYNYNKDSYGVFVDDITPIDAYVELSEVESVDTHEPSVDNGGIGNALQSTTPSIAGNGSQVTPSGEAEDTAKNSEKKWYEKLLEDKVKLFIIAACAVVAGWLIFSKEK